MRGYVLGVISLLAVCFLATPYAGRLLLHLVALPYPSIAVGDAPAADAIAVLSGTGPPHHRPLGPGELPNRLDAGLALFRARKAPLLVLTAQASDWDERRSEVASELPPADVLIVGPAKNTREEAECLAQAAEARHWRTVLLVTSGYHVRRARLLLERCIARRSLSLIVIAFPADTLYYERWPAGSRLYLPGAAGLGYTGRAAKEILGSIGAFF